MDILGKENLEEMLINFKGTLIFVSHDRFFVKKISNCILEFDNGKTQFYDYGYDYYIEKKQSEKIENIEVIKKEKLEKKKYNNPLKEKDKIQKRINKLEEKIANNEEKIHELENECQKEEICSDYMKITKIQEKIDELTKELENDMNTWENLEKELEKIDLLDS